MIMAINPRLGSLGSSLHCSGLRICQAELVEEAMRVDLRLGRWALTSRLESCDKPRTGSRCDILHVLLCAARLLQLHQTERLVHLKSRLRVCSLRILYVDLVDVRRHVDCRTGHDRAPLFSFCLAHFCSSKGR